MALVQIRNSPTSTFCMSRAKARLRRIIRSRFVESLHSSEVTDTRAKISFYTLTCCSRLALTQSRDDCSLREADIKHPHDDIKRQYPVFCLRLALARLTNRYTTLGSECNLQHLRFANKVDELMGELTMFKENMPVGFQPENEISVGPGQYHPVLLLHAEFYALQVTMYTALGAAVDGSSGWLAIESHPSIRIRKQTTFRVSSSRRLLQTLSKINESTHPGPNVLYWYADFCFLLCLYTRLWLTRYHVGSREIKFSRRSTSYTHIS
jgi:hypothetical protein